MPGPGGPSEYGEVSDSREGDEAEPFTAVKQLHIIWLWIIAYGAWVSLSKASFDRTSELWLDPRRVEEPPTFGWLSNSIPGYPETLNLKTSIHSRLVGFRPLIELEPNGASFGLGAEERNNPRHGSAHCRTHVPPQLSGREAPEAVWLVLSRVLLTCARGTVSGTGTLRSGSLVVLDYDVSKLLILLVRMRGLEPPLPCEN